MEQTKLFTLAGCKSLDSIRMDIAAHLVGRDSLTASVWYIRKDEFGGCVMSSIEVKNGPGFNDAVDTILMNIYRHHTYDQYRILLHADEAQQERTREAVLTEGHPYGHYLGSLVIDEEELYATIHGHLQRATRRAGLEVTAR